MKKKKAILFIGFLLFLASFASAKEDFTAASSNAVIDMCVLSEKQDAVTITNIGNTYSEYFITLGGSAEKYVTAVPSKISLMPGKSAVFSNYFNFPNDATGKYKLSINIRTGMGVEKELIQDVNSRLCNNNALIAHNFNQSACPCLQMTYNFSVKNTGSYVETYVFGVDRFAEYANISTNPLILGPGEEAKVRLYLNLDCGIYGDFIINFFSEAGSSGIISKVPLLINIDECYDYDIKTGKLLDNNDNKFNASFADTAGNYTMCGGDDKSIQVMIDNSGYIGNNFFYTLEGESWGSLYGNVLMLDGYDKGYSYLDLRPSGDIEGEFKFVISAESQRGNAGKQKIVTVNVEDCYAISAELQDEKIFCGCEQSTINANIQNLGRFKENISMQLEGPDFVNLSENKISVAAGSSEDVQLVINPSCWQKGKYTIKVKANLDNGHAYSEDSSGIEIVPQDKCYGLKTKALATRAGYNKSAIPVTVKHIGRKKADYRISVSAPEWLKTDSSSFSLEPGKQYSFNIITEPMNASPGYYYAVLNISTSNVVYQKKIKILLSEDEGTIARILGAIKYYRYWIITVLIALALLLMLALHLKEKARVWRIRKLIKSATNNKKHEKKNGKKKKSTWLYWLVGILIIAGLVFIAIYYKESTLAALRQIWAFILSYILYIIIGFVILWVIIAILDKQEK